MQLLELSASSKFKLTLKLGKEAANFKARHTELTYTSERFDKILIDVMKAEPFRKVWVCGPPAMSTAILA
jgi:hypothetical protein